jgi:hypothetical protein
MEPEPIKKTPMDKVWVVVLSTTMLTAFFVYGWHVLVMRSLTADHLVEKALLHVEINGLSSYRDQLRGTSTEPLTIRHLR